MTVGVLGRVACHLVTVSEPSFTSSPDTRQVTVWDTIEPVGPGWAAGGGTAVVPVSGTYLIAIGAEVNASDAGAVPVGAGFSAVFEPVLLGLFCPVFPVDDSNATTWVAGTAVTIAQLNAGDAIAVDISAHDSDASLAFLGIHRLTLDLVRL